MNRHNDIKDTAAYLAEHAKTDFKNMPEGTVMNVLNRASPEVRDALSTHYLGAQHLIESGGRLRPFEEKLDVTAQMPPAMRQTYQRAEDESTYMGLQERLGTQEANERIINDAPISLRDIIDASYDATAGE